MAIIDDRFAEPGDDREPIDGRTPDTTSTDGEDWRVVLVGTETPDAAANLVAGTGPIGVEAQYARAIGAIPAVEATINMLSNLAVRVTARMAASLGNAGENVAVDHGAIIFNGHQQLRYEMSYSAPDSLLELFLVDVDGTTRFIGSATRAGTPSPFLIVMEFYTPQGRIEVFADFGFVSITDVITDWPLRDGTYYGFLADVNGNSATEPAIFCDEMKIRSITLPGGPPPPPELDELCVWYRSDTILECIPEVEDCSFNITGPTGGADTVETLNAQGRLLHNMVQNTDYVAVDVCNQEDGDPCSVTEDPASAVLIDGNFAGTPTFWLNREIFGSANDPFEGVYDFSSIHQPTFTTSSQPPVPFMFQNQNVFDDADGWTVFYAVQLEQVPSGDGTSVFGGDLELLFNDIDDGVGLALSSDGPTGVRAHLNYGPTTVTLNVLSPLNRILLFRAQYNPVTDVLTLWEICSGAEVTGSVTEAQRPNSVGLELLKPATNATGGRYNAEKHFLEYLHYCISLSSAQNDDAVEYFVAHYDIADCPAGGLLGFGYLLGG